MPLTRHPLERDHLRGRGTRVRDGGGEGDGGDREGPARVINTTTSASLRALLPASLADLRVTAYSPDILSNGIISGGEERDGGGEGDGGDDGGDYYDLFVCCGCSVSRFTPVLYFL